MEMKKIFFALFIVFGLSGMAQVVTLQPTFVTQDDTVTVIFDASLGNGELAGVAQVYAHTGVITNASSTNTDWRHVQGNWGTADNKVKMTALGNDRHMIQYHIKSFYNIPAAETAYRLAFVFRDAAGNKVGRASDGSDIFVDLFQGGYEARFTLPDQRGLVVDLGDQIALRAEASEPSTISIFQNGTLVQQKSNAKLLDATINTSNFSYGKYYLTMTADNGAGNVVTDTFYYVAKGGVNIAPSPNGIVDGINYLNDTSVVLQLVAPFKDYVFVIGDFSNWEYDPKYFMNKTPSGDRYWVQINGLTAGKEYRFQYSIGDEAMRVADVYSDKILDPWNDKWIPASIYPNLTPYPEGKTTYPVGVLHPGEQPYQWDNTINYQRPSKENLIIYELLLRDFTKEHSYQSVIDSLDYFERLGINAIQLMPIMEFEGNESWGYNPMFFCAPDKYYGPKDDLKKLVEECHRRNIAVILDIAINHSFGQNPQVRMYFDPSAGQWGQPTANSPWFNQVAKHDFNVGYDYNHTSQYTKDFTKRVIAYWIEEFKVDGYRFDLSKGFTQKNTLGNIGAWNAYDQQRVDIWNEYSSHIWSKDPTAYVILEHLADNSEETVLANNGMMPWGNLHGPYKELSIGYSGNIDWASYKTRGWNDSHAVVYACSHDEERHIYEAVNYGNSVSGYNLKNLKTALERQEMIAAFLMAIPGPKMIWQFDELGYPYSINYCPDGTINPDCRTANKPIRWDYFEDPDRYRLYRAFGAVFKLKRDYPTFSTSNFNIDVAGSGKIVHLYHPDMDAAIIGNFAMSNISMIPGFSSTGWWYDYFTGDSINVTDVNASMNFEVGEFHIYTNKKLPQPEFEKWVDPNDTTGIGVVEQPLNNGLNLSGFPNPFNEVHQINVRPEEDTKVNINILDFTGRLVKNLAQNIDINGEYAFYWKGDNAMGDKVAPGIYFCTVNTGTETKTYKLIFGGN